MLSGSVTGMTGDADFIEQLIRIAETPEQTIVDKDRRKAALTLALPKHNSANDSTVRVLMENPDWVRPVVTVAHMSNDTAGRVNYNTWARSQTGDPVKAMLRLSHHGIPTNDVMDQLELLDAAVSTVDEALEVNRVGAVPCLKSSITAAAVVGVENLLEVINNADKTVKRWRRAAYRDALNNAAGTPLSPELAAERETAEWHTVARELHPHAARANIRASVKSAREAGLSIEDYRESIGGDWLSVVEHFDNNEQLAVSTAAEDWQKKLYDPEVREPARPVWGR